MKDKSDKAKRVIIGLGIGVILYEISIVVNHMLKVDSALTSLDLPNILLKSMIHSFIGLVIIYAIYKRNNFAKRLWGGLCAIGLISSIAIIISGNHKVITFVSLSYFIINLLSLANFSVVDYTRAYDE